MVVSIDIVCVDVVVVIKVEDFEGVMEVLLKLWVLVDWFFEDILVNVEDVVFRMNWL